MEIGEVKRSAGAQVWKPILAGIGVLTGLAMMALGVGGVHMHFAIHGLSGKEVLYGEEALLGLGGAAAVAAYVVGLRHMMHTRSPQEEVAMVPTQRQSLVQLF